MYQIDEIDHQIVNLLMEDGRMPCAEIARRIGSTSERAVRYRLEQMAAVGLIQISAIANPKMLGFTVVADIFIEVEPARINDLARQLAKFGCVSYVACSIGENDISVQIYARNTDEVYDFVTNTIGQMPGVRKTTTSIVPQVMKDSYQWRIPSESVQRKPASRERKVKKER